MAKIIQAYRRYGPKIKRDKTAHMSEIADFIVERTGVEKRVVCDVLKTLQDAILHFARQGRGVRLDGIISLWPIVNTKGNITFGRRFASGLGRALNNIDRFNGHLKNYERRNWCEEDYRCAWNEEFPDDPIE